MMHSSSRIGKFDWTTIFLYFALVAFGWVNIYSASLSDTSEVFFNFDYPYSKQLVFIGLSVILILFILGVDSKFYERFSSIIYLLSILSLLGLFVFGSTIAGQRAWYNFGPLSLQPAEFVKAATALALAKYLSDIQTNLKNFKDQIQAFVIIGIPIVLILMQPDPGSALVFFALIIPMYREGLHFVYLLLGFIVAFLFVLTLLIDPPLVIFMVLFIALLVYYRNRNRKPNLFKYILICVMSIGFTLSVDHVFDNVLKQHHRDRFNIVLGKEVDLRGVGYNTHQSEIAVGSGGWFGKGWTQGTQTKGSFVPEQHTDYIFSTVGEEWGFVGSFAVVVLFVFLILRILHLAEKQKSTFNRVYGYSVAAILFIHFFVNISMVIGIFPTVGIPLPFLSYGGSGLWAFTVLVFIFLRLDSQKHIHG